MKLVNTYRIIEFLVLLSVVFALPSCTMDIFPNNPKNPKNYERNFIFIDIEDNKVVFYQSNSLDGSTLPGHSRFSVSFDRGIAWWFEYDIRDANPKKEFCSDNYERIVSKVIYGVAPDCTNGGDAAAALNLNMKYTIHGYIYKNRKYESPYFILTDCNNDINNLCLETNARATKEFKSNLKKAISENKHRYLIH